MKKSVFFLAFAIFALSLSSCQKIGDDSSQKSNDSSIAIDSSSSVPSFSDKTDSSFRSTQESSSSGLPSNVHVISFNTKGGSPIPDQYVVHGEKIKKPDNPTKLGYSFNRWTYQGEDWSFIGYVVTEDMVLDAEWDLVYYKLIYDYGVVDHYSSDSYTIESDFDLYTPSITGYAFIEWTLNGKPIDHISKGTTGDITLVANWKQIFEWHWENESPYQLVFDKLVDQEIENLIISDDIGVISSDAFANCSSIKTVSFKRVGSISDNAFSNCPSLESVSFDYVRSIGKSVFSNCPSLKSIRIDDGLHYYSDSGYSLFSGCSSLETISLPSTIFSCGLFGVLFGRENYYNGVKVAQTYSRDGVDYGGVFYVPASLKTIIINGESDSVPEAFFMEFRMVESFIFDGILLNINDGAFYGCSSLRNLSLPDSLRSVGDQAFANCFSLTSFTVGPNIRLIEKETSIPGVYTLSSTISDTAFKGCLSLLEIINKANSPVVYNCFSDDVWFINDESESLLVQDDNGFIYYIENEQKILVHYYGHESFLSIPDSFDELRDGAFAGCQTIISIRFSEKITELTANLFLDTPILDSIIFTKQINFVASGSITSTGICFIYFYGDETDWENITFEHPDDKTYAAVVGVDSAEFVDTGRFRYILLNNSKAYDFQVIDDQIESFDIEKDFPDYPVVYIGLGFYQCPKVETIVLSKDVIYFNNYYLSLMNSLRSIIVDDNNPRFSSLDGSLCIKGEDRLFFVPSNITGSFVVPDGIVSVSQGCFRNSSLTNIVLPSTVNTIGSFAFFDCSLLESIVIPSGVDRLSYASFAYCYSLETITIPLSVKSFEQYCFFYCSNVKTINYEGTSRQWKSITKAANWDRGMAEGYTINYSYSN